MSAGEDMSQGRYNIHTSKAPKKQSNERESLTYSVVHCISPMYKHKHTHTHARTCIHTHMHAHAYTHIHAYISPNHVHSMTSSDCTRAAPICILFQTHPLWPVTCHWGSGSCLTPLSVEDSDIHNLIRCKERVLM